MACDLTRSRTRNCKNSIGGNSKLFLYNSLEDAFTVVASEATAMNVALTAAYAYELEGDLNTLEEVIIGERQNGSRFNTQTLTISLKGMSAADAAEFNLLASSFSQGVIKDRNGNYLCLGLDDGMDWQITATTGGAKGDLNGYTIVGTATTAELAPTMDASTETAFLAVVV